MTTQSKPKDDKAATVDFENLTASVPFFPAKGGEECDPGGSNCYPMNGQCGPKNCRPGQGWRSEEAGEEPEAEEEGAQTPPIQPPTP